MLHTVFAELLWQYFRSLGHHKVHALKRLIRPKPPRGEHGEYSIFHTECEYRASVELRWLRAGADPRRAPVKVSTE